MKLANYTRDVDTGDPILTGSTQILGPDGLPIATVPVDAITGRWAYQANGQPGKTTAVFTGAGQTRKIAGDAYVQASDIFLGEFPDILQIFRDGVFGEATMPLSAPGGMNVRVGIGSGLVLGRFMPVYVAQDLPVTAAHATLNRIDAIVMRLTRTGTFAGSVALAIVAGTPAATAAPPVLTQTAATWEVKIGEVSVAAAALAITLGNVSEVGRRYAGPRHGRVLTAKRAFTASNFISVHEAFGPEFRHYEVILAIDTATSASSSLRMALTTGRAVTGTYDWTYVARDKSGSALTSGGSGDADVRFAPTWFNGDVNFGFKIDVYDPMAAGRQTHLAWNGIESVSSNEIAHAVGGAVDRAATVCEGFRISVPVGLMIGNIYVYGVGA